MAYMFHSHHQNPIAFGVSRRRNFRGALQGLGADSSAVPNPPNLTAPPNPQLVQPPTSANPLNYVSPQQAIAQGVDPATANAAWAQLVNSYASVQDAVNAGLAPTVVTDLWTGGAVPAPVPWWKKYAPLLLAGGGAALLILGGKREAR